MKPEAKRILLLTTAYRPLVGGSEVAIEQVTKRLPNIFFDLLTPRLTATARQQEQESNVFIQRLGWGTNFDKWWFLVSGFWRANHVVASPDQPNRHLKFVSIVQNMSIWHEAIIN